MDHGAPFHDQVSRRTLLLLALALAPAFTATALVDNAYRARQRALAAEWGERGEAALAALHPEQAIDAFRNALSFSRDDRRFRLRLAQALGAANRPSEARAYLLTLWEDQPGNGPVNLELARITAASHDVAGATRYYHNAIEGAWTDRVEGARRSARLELSDFLMREGATAQAEAELVALAGDLPPEPEEQQHVAGLMLRAGLARAALPIYRRLLARRPADAAPLTGAGAAAFTLGQYDAAVTYLSRASRARPLGPDEAATLEIARLVVSLDPFRRHLPARQRAERTLMTFDAASARLRMCPVPASADLQMLDAERAALAPRLREAALGRDEDLVDEAMDLAFRMETAALGCGQLLAVDRALLILAQQHEGTAS